MMFKRNAQGTSYNKVLCVHIVRACMYIYMDVHICIYLMYIVQSIESPRALLKCLSY